MAKKTKISAKLTKYLDGTKYKILEHKTVYTAFDVAATTRRKLDEVAKSLFVKADRDYYLVILPADCNLDFKKLGKCLEGRTGRKIKAVKIPGEKIMSKILKVKAGAASAFGGLRKMPVVIDNGLIKAKKAVFSSGSFNHSIEMAVKDFVKLENAVLGSVGAKKRVKIQKAARPAKSVKRPKPTAKKTAKNKKSCQKKK